MYVIWAYRVDTTRPGIELDGGRYSGVEYEVEVGGVDGLLFFPLLLVLLLLPKPAYPMPLEAPM